MQNAARFELESNLTQRAGERYSAGISLAMLGTMRKRTILGIAISASFLLAALGEHKNDVHDARPEKRATRVPRAEMDYIELAYIEAAIFDGPVRCDQIALGERLYATCTRTGFEPNRLWLYEGGKFAPLNSRARQDSEHLPLMFRAKLVEMPPPHPADIVITDALNEFRR